MTPNHYDLLGIGAGPFSLSLAALLEATQLKVAFFERQGQYQWHPGMLLPNAKLQNSYLRDLVTGVDPTNRHSFLNYLVDSGRFYRFLHADESAISRQEFNLYLQWVASRMPQVHKNCEVAEVDFDESQQRFCVTLSDQRQFLSQHLSVGTGKRARVPDCAQAALGDNCFHASEIALRAPDFKKKRVAIIGGGQTGAEVFLNLLKNTWGKPAAIQWLSRRDNLEPLDETPFTNDYFAPGYAAAFQHLPKERKKALLEKQKLASDGISPETLRELYQTLYQYEISGQLGHHISIRPKRELRSLSSQRGRLQVICLNQFDYQWETEQVDAVVLCTGYRYALAECLHPLAERLQCDSQFGMPLSREYRVAWDGPSGNRIYALNAGLLSHGIVEPQMSLNAVRAATIVNDVCNAPVYNLNSESYMQWRHPDANCTDVVAA